MLLKIKKRIFKQTHDKKLAESSSPITNKLAEPTKKIGEVINPLNSERENNQEIVPVEVESEDEIIQTKLKALPNSSSFSDLMAKTLGILMSNSTSLRITMSFRCLNSRSSYIYSRW